MHRHVIDLTRGKAIVWVALEDAVRFAIVRKERVTFADTWLTGMRAAGMPTLPVICTRDNKAPQCSMDHERTVSKRLRTYRLARTPL